MRNLFYYTLFFILTLILASPTQAQEDKKSEKWDVNAPFGPTKEVSFSTDEGTWITVDVHPNGENTGF